MFQQTMFGMRPTTIFILNVSEVFNSKAFTWFQKHSLNILFYLNAPNSAAVKKKISVENQIDSNNVFNRFSQQSAKEKEEESPGRKTTMLNNKIKIYDYMRE